MNELERSDKFQKSKAKRTEITQKTEITSGLIK